MTRAPLAAAALLVAVTAGCVTPARNDEQYTAKAVTTVEATASEVATARLVLAQRLDRRVTGPYADEVVTAAETAVGAVSDAFGVVQPPSAAADEVRDDVTALVGDAEDAVVAARIAVRRDDAPAVRAALLDLDVVADHLEAAEQELR